MIESHFPPVTGAHARCAHIGIGSCPATVYDHDRARAILGYPDDRFCGYILSFGYPTDPAELTRPPKAGGRRSGFFLAKPAAVL